MNFDIADSLSDFHCFFSAELYVLGCEVLFPILDCCQSSLIAPVSWTHGIGIISFPEPAAMPGLTVLKCSPSSWQAHSTVPPRSDFWEVFTVETRRFHFFEIATFEVVLRR
jgi:hypothetical protein